MASSSWGLLQNLFAIKIHAETHQSILNLHLQKAFLVAALLAFSYIRTLLGDYVSICLVLRPVVVAPAGAAVAARSTA